MGLLGPSFSPRRWERARSVVEEHLRCNASGLSGIALVDRLTHGGFGEDEAMAVLRAMQEQGELTLSGGRWVLTR